MRKDDLEDNFGQLGSIHHRSILLDCCILDSDPFRCSQQVIRGICKELSVNPKFYKGFGGVNRRLDIHWKVYNRLKETENADQRISNQFEAWKSK